MDIGSEYRSMIGLKGGTKHSLYSLIKKIAKRNGYKVLVGKGSDPDTLGKQLVYLYDTDEFSFCQAEIYHQFRVRYNRICLMFC